MYEITRNVLAEVKKAIVGKDGVISKVWIALLAEGHVLLEDVPGVGKTTMALAFSRALGLDTKRIQFTPDTMPSDIIGFSMPGKDGMVYQPGAIMTNLLLADEINRTSSKTQSALLEAMEEGQVTVDRVTHPLPRPFAVLATQNPVGSAGTQDLPNSQLDRFLMKLSMGYPDLQSQIHILRDRSGEDPLTRVQAVADREALCEAIRRVRAIHIADPVYDYIARLTEATRSHPMVRLGISPRGALALCRCAKAAAFAAGRDFVLPEDAAELVPYVFGHRLMLSSRARLKRLYPRGHSGPGAGGDPRPGHDGADPMTQALWVLCLLLLAAGYIADPSGPVLAAGLAALALPVLSWLAVLLCRRKLRAELSCPASAEKGRPAAVRLTLRRPRALPVGRVRFHLAAENTAPAKPPA